MDQRKDCLRHQLFRVGLKDEKQIYVLKQADNYDHQHIYVSLKRIFD